MERLVETSSLSLYGAGIQKFLDEWPVLAAKIYYRTSQLKDTLRQHLQAFQILKIQPLQHDALHPSLFQGC